MHLHRLAVKISWFDRPVLALALVRRQFNRVAIAKVESFVDVEDCLYPVVTRGYIVETLCRITQSGTVYHRRCPRRECVHIRTKDLLRVLHDEVHLKTRLFVIVVRDEQQDVAIEWGGGDFFCERDFKSLSRRLRGFPFCRRDGSHQRKDQGDGGE